MSTRVFVVVLACVCLGSSVWGASEAKLAEEYKYTIEGQVVDCEGKGIESSTLLLISPFNSEKEEDSFEKIDVKDSDGKFRITKSLQFDETPVTEPPAYVFKLSAFSIYRGEENRFFSSPIEISVSPNQPQNVKIVLPKFTYNATYIRGFHEIKGFTKSGRIYGNARVDDDGDEKKATPKTRPAYIDVNEKDRPLHFIDFGLVNDGNQNLSLLSFTEDRHLLYALGEYTDAKGNLSYYLWESAENRVSKIGDETPVVPQAYRFTELRFPYLGAKTIERTPATTKEQDYYVLYNLEGKWSMRVERNFAGPFRFNDKLMTVEDTMGDLLIYDIAKKGEPVHNDFMKFNMGDCKPMVYEISENSVVVGHCIGRVPGETNYGFRYERGKGLWKLSTHFGASCAMSINANSSIAGMAYRKDVFGDKQFIPILWKEGFAYPVSHFTELEDKRDYNVPGEVHIQTLCYFASVWIDNSERILYQVGGKPYAVLLTPPSSEELSCSNTPSTNKQPNYQSTLQP